MLLGSLDASTSRSCGAAVEGGCEPAAPGFCEGRGERGVVGPGKVDGQGPMFWVPSGRLLLPVDAWRDVTPHARLAAPAFADD